MPEISLPDIKLPDIRFRDAKLRDLKMPDIDLRDRMPDVDLSKLSLPSGLREMSMPQVSTSDMKMPSMPDIHMPAFNLRDVKAPKVDLSDVDLRSLDPRRLDLSGLDARRLRDLVPFARPAPKPMSPMPYVALAAVAGLFAGWWLATSSLTGPKMRDMAAQVRGRIDEWRAARGEWDDGEQRTQGFWSKESGWKDTGSQPEAAPAEGSFQRDVRADDGWESSASTAAIGGSEPDSGIGGTSYEAPAGDGIDGSDREG